MDFFNYLGPADKSGNSLYKCLKCPPRVSKKSLSCHDRLRQNLKKHIRALIARYYFLVIRKLWKVWKLIRLHKCRCPITFLNAKHSFELVSNYKQVKTTLLRSNSPPCLAIHPTLTEPQGAHQLPDTDFYFKLFLIEKKVFRHSFHNAGGQDCGLAG